MSPDASDSSISRRRFLVGAGAAGLATAAPALAIGPAAGASPSTHPSAARSTPTSGDATPEQIHLTWGADPATSVVVSWASVGEAKGARVVLEPRGPGRSRTVPGRQRIYTDGLNGETVWTYHAELTGLRPDTSYTYLVTADGDRRGAHPFTADFRTAPTGRQPFRFTSFGDLATPNTAWVLSYGQSAYAVDQVSAERPLFHLLNGDLCYANLNPTSQPEVWRDFGNNNQRSAAFRPWMPCPGNHELEFDNGPQGLDSYLTRYTLPDNGVPGFAGRWYSFRVGAAMFISLNADDVIYQDCSALVSGPDPLVPVASTGNPPIEPGTSLYVPGYSRGKQTVWLERTLAAARADDSIDWIVVQMHECAMSSSANGNGSDLGIRQAWLGLFDEYEVDLVVYGHDHDYERSFPIRGNDPGVGWDATTLAPVNTLRPHPVTTVDSGVFDTSKGTVHLVLGSGGTSANLDSYGLDAADNDTEAKVFTKRNAPQEVGTTGTFVRAAADAREDAVWSAKRDTTTGYGLAVFDVEPGSHPEDLTSIRVTYLHALGADPTNPNTGAPGAPTPNYTVFETFTLVRPRCDRPRHGHGRGSGAEAEPAAGLGRRRRRPRPAEPGLIDTIRPGSGSGQGPGRSRGGGTGRKGLPPGRVPRNRTRCVTEHQNEVKLPRSVTHRCRPADIKCTQNSVKLPPGAFCVHLWRFSGSCPGDSGGSTRREGPEGLFKVGNASGALSSRGS